MTAGNSTRKPAKPRADFPLFAHKNGSGRRRSTANIIGLGHGGMIRKVNAHLIVTSKRRTTCMQGPCRPIEPIRTQRLRTFAIGSWRQRR